MPAAGATFCGVMKRPSVVQVVVLTLAGVILMVLGIGQLLADQWQVETTRTLPGPPAHVAALVSDLGSWQRWSDMKVNLGPQTKREVEGLPGTVGQRIAWTGVKGRATLTLTAVAPDAIEYEYGYEVAGAPRGTGRIAWAADGAGCRVTWRDGGRWRDLWGRWAGWFGALQERTRQVHSASLTGLELELRGGPPAAK